MVIAEMADRPGPIGLYLPYRAAFSTPAFSTPAFSTPDFQRPHLMQYFGQGLCPSPIRGCPPNTMLPTHQARYLPARQLASPSRQYSLVRTKCAPKFATGAAPFHKGSKNPPNSLAHNAYGHCVSLTQCVLGPYEYVCQITSRSVEPFSQFTRTLQTDTLSHDLIARPRPLDGRIKSKNHFKSCNLCQLLIVNCDKAFYNICGVVQSYLLGEVAN